MNFLNVFLKRRETIKNESAGSHLWPLNPHPRSPPPNTRCAPPQLPTVSPELPASADTRGPKGPSVKTSGLAEVTFSQVDGRRLPADAGEGRAGSVPRLAHVPVRAGLRVGGRPRRPELPGLPLPPHGRPRPSAGSGLSAPPPAGRRQRGDVGWGASGGPPKTYHGPGGKQGLNIHPSHTYTAQPPNRRREQNKEKSRGRESVPCSRAQ